MTEKLLTMQKKLMNYEGKIADWLSVEMKLLQNIRKLSPCKIFAKPIKNLYKIRQRWLDHMEVEPLPGQVQNVRKM